jgi:hypothetical protein
MQRKTRRDRKCRSRSHFSPACQWRLNRGGSWRKKGERLERRKRKDREKESGKDQRKKEVYCLGPSIVPLLEKFTSESRTQVGVILPFNPMDCLMRIKPLVANNVSEF